MDPEKKEETKVETKVETPPAPAPITPKGLESFTEVQLQELYAKTPEIFEKAGLVKKAEEKKGAEKTPPEGAAQPDGLKLKLPDDVPVDEASLKSFKQIMGDKKLSDDEKAQKIIDLQAEQYRKSVADAKQREKEYEEVLKKDPDFGKDYEANMELSKQGLALYDKSGEAAKRLVEIGAHKDPVLTRYFREVGRASAEAQTKRPGSAPSKEAETEQAKYQSRYNNSPEMFEGETTP